MEHLFWDYQLYREGKRAREVAESAKTRATSVSEDVEELRERMDRLTLVCHAMWELIADRTQLTEEDLVRHIEVVDLRDGKLDGKVKSPPKLCPSCSRPSSARRTRCLYCGDELPESKGFERV